MAEARQAADENPQPETTEADETEDSDAVETLVPTREDKGSTILGLPSVVVYIGAGHSSHCPYSRGDHPGHKEKTGSHDRSSAIPTIPNASYSTAPTHGYSSRP